MKRSTRKLLRQLHFRCFRPTVPKHQNRNPRRLPRGVGARFPSDSGGHNTTRRCVALSERRSCWLHDSLLLLLPLRSQRDCTQRCNRDPKAQAPDAGEKSDVVNGVHALENVWSPCS